MAAGEPIPEEQPREDRPGNGHDRRPPPKEPRRVRARRWARENPRGFAGVVAGAVVLVIAAVFLWRYLASYERTDDAQVDGHIAQVSARVAGTVQAIHVDENQRVKKGELLLELDPRDYQVALARAEAALEQARAELQVEDPRVEVTRVTQQTQVTTSQQSVGTARAQLAAAERDQDAAQARIKETEARAIRARADLGRSRYLLQERAIPQERFDQVLAELRAANAELESARALARRSSKMVAEAREQVRIADARRSQAERTAPQQVQSQRASVNAKLAAVMAAQAQLERAKLDLAYTRVVAPFDGLVGRRAAELGQHVSPGEQLLAIVDTSELWVTANFKETQLRKMRPGQRARIHVDAYDVALDGYVESLGAATGTLYSLLPPENATGNYVKVVQRVPVRLRWKPGQPAADKLVPGLSVEPKVYLK